MFHRDLHCSLAFLHFALPPLSPLAATMRPLSSVLAIKRSKHDDSSTASEYSVASSGPRIPKPRSSALFARAPTTLVEICTDPSMRPRPLLTPGSSSSSEGSASLRTPEDESMAVFPADDGKRRWSNWFGLRKASDRQSVAEDDEVPQVVRSEKSRPQIAERPQRASRSSLNHEIISEDEDEDSESDSEESVITASSPPLPAMPSSISSARVNLLTIIRNNLATPVFPPPLVDMPSSPQFPRSANSYPLKPFAHTFESAFLSKRLLRRLERKNLTLVEMASIASFATRSKPLKAAVKYAEKSDEDVMANASMRVGRFSRGLRQWALRPCFEQRVTVWMPNENGAVVSRRVQGVGRGLAVFDLEVSERIEVLAGLDMDDETFEKALCLKPTSARRCEC